MADAAWFGVLFQKDRFMRVIYLVGTVIHIVGRKAALTTFIGFLSSWYARQIDASITCNCISWQRQWCCFYVFTIGERAEELSRFGDVILLPHPGLFVQSVGDPVVLMTSYLFLVVLCYHKHVESRVYRHSIIIILSNVLTSFLC